MSRYIKRPEIVEAFYVTPETMKNRGPFPDWATPYILIPESLQGRNDCFYLNTDSGSFEFTHGYYIVRSPLGAVYLLTQSTFKILFKEIIE